MNEPKKSPQVPAAAFWDDDVWAIGKKDGAGKKIGDWVYFRTDGTKEGEEEWGDAKIHLTYRRFHPEGSLAQSGAKDLKRDVWVGPMVWTRLDAPSVEDRFWPDAAPENARRYEKIWNDRGEVTLDRLFDGAGARITWSGKPFPDERPSTVDENADLTNGDTRWEAGRTSIDKSKYYGEYRVWDRNGTLLERRVADDDGNVQRIETYDDGALWSTKVYADGEMTQSFYRKRGGEPVLRSSTLYRNGDKDRTQTLYDTAGAPLYSVRMEQVSEEHVRRYENGVLVYEAKWSTTGERTPDVKYWDGDRLMVDYQSHGNGRGTFTLYARDGGAEATLDFDDEKDANRYGNWNPFMRGFARYEADRKKTDVEEIRESFLDAADQARFEKAVSKVEIPAAWRVIRDVDWKKSASANRRAKLDRLLVVMLGDDPRLADRAAGEILGAVEEQDCLFQSTYDVALTLTKLLPALEKSPPAIRTRAMKTLAEIVRFPAMPHELPKRYREVVTALAKQTKALRAFAREHDDEDGHAVMHVLALLGDSDVMKERLADPKASVGTRTFAATALSVCRSKSDKEAKAWRAHTVKTLRAAFAREKDVGVRAVFGVLTSLLHGAGSGDDAIDALLAEYLVAPKRHPELHEAWRPVVSFLGDDIGSTLFRAVPEETRLANIGRVIDGVRSRGALEQAEDLDIVFRTLFSEGADTELTPLHERALLAAADVVDAHAGFVNHAEVFRAHGLPWDSFQLRELVRSAARAKPKDAAPAPARTGGKRGEVKAKAKARTAQKTAKAAAATAKTPRSRGAKKTSGRASKARPTKKQKTAKAPRRRP